MNEPEPTPRKLLGSDSHDTNASPIRQPEEVAERERWRYRIAKHWRSIGKRTWTDAEMESAIDKMMRRERVAAAAVQPPQANAATVQKALFGADEAASKTRAAAAQKASLRSSRFTRVADAVKRAGNYGRTADELSVELDIPIQSMPNIIGELIKAGMLIRTKRTRLTRTNSAATVLVYNHNAGGDQH